MKKLLDLLKNKYPKIFDGAVEIRQLSPPSIIGNITEIVYENGNIRSVRWGTAEELKSAFKKLEEGL